MALIQSIGPLPATKIQPTNLPQQPTGIDIPGHGTRIMEEDVGRVTKLGFLQLQQTRGRNNSTTQWDPEMEDVESHSHSPEEATRSRDGRVAKAE